MKFTNMKTKALVLALSLLSFSNTALLSNPAEEKQCGKEMGQLVADALLKKNDPASFISYIENIEKTIEQNITVFDDKARINKAFAIVKALHTYIKSIKKADLSHAQKIGAALEKLYETFPPHVFEAFQAAFLERQALYINKRKPLDKLTLGLALIKKLNKQ